MIWAEHLPFAYPIPFNLFAFFRFLTPFYFLFFLFLLLFSFSFFPFSFFSVFLHLLMITRTHLAIVSFVAIFLAASCQKKSDNVTPLIPNEAITTVILTATPASGGAPSVAKWTQKYGADGNPIGAPDTTAAILELKANTTYVGTIAFVDSTQTPPVNITNEIIELGKEHLVFYQPTPTRQPLVIPNTSNSATDSTLAITLTPTDRDNSAAAFPVGIATNIVTGKVSAGRLRIVLRHQPEGKNGTYAPGSSDVDIRYRVNIKQ